MMEEAQTKGERTSQAIIEAAYSLFIEQGFHATSMRQIAQQAGIALSGIYNHFESKEQIFDRVLLDKHPYRQVLAILQAAPGDTIETFVHNAARAGVAELGRRPDFLKLVFIELSEFRGQHAPHLYQTIFPKFLPLVDRFSSMQGKARDLPPRAIIFSFLGMIFSYYLTEAALNADNALALDTTILEQYLDIFLHGILQPEKP